MLWHFYVSLSWWIVKKITTKRFSSRNVNCFLFFSFFIFCVFVLIFARCFFQPWKYYFISFVIFGLDDGCWSFVKLNCHFMHSIHDLFQCTWNIHGNNAKVQQKDQFFSLSFTSSFLSYRLNDIKPHIIAAVFSYVCNLYYFCCLCSLYLCIATNMCYVCIYYYFFLLGCIRFRTLFFFSWTIIAISNYNRNFMLMCFFKTLVHFVFVLRLFFILKEKERERTKNENRNARRRKSKCEKTKWNEI